MNLLETLRIAWEALVSNKLRSILTMLGIIIGVGSVIAVVAIGRGTQAAVLGELEGMGSGLFQIMVGGRGEPGQVLERQVALQQRDIDLLKALLPDVEEAVAVNGIGTTVRYGNQSKNTSVSGTHAAAPKVLNLKIQDGRWFTPQEEAAGARVLVIGADGAERLMGKGVDPVGQTVSVGGYPFQVIGVLQKDTGMLTRLMNNQDDSLYVPITFIQRMTGSRDLFGLLVKARVGTDPGVVMKDAVALLERSHNGAKFSGMNFAEVTSSVTSITTILTGVIAAIAGISLVVGGVGIMNIMLVSVTERTREIGLRKAIGATYRDVLVQFLIESVVICLVGGIVGVAIASIPVVLVGRWLQISLLIDWKSIALALGFSVGVGVLFGVYPASKAARLNPIEALRYE